MSEQRNIFESGPNAHSMDLGFGPDPKPLDEPAADAGSVTLTKAQFDALLAQFGQRKTENDYAAALQGTEPEPLTMPEFDLSTLPDPRQDFEGFRTGLANVLTTGREQILEQATSVVQTTHQHNSIMDDAWAMMQEKHPDIAQYTDIIGMSAQAEISELTARGIDPMRALQFNMEHAVERIAQRANATISKIRGIPSDPEGNDPGRTEMLSGASPRPSQRGGRETAPPATSFVDELKKIQRELGVY